MNVLIPDFLDVNRKKAEAKREYYETRQEAEAERQRGERIYYKPTKGYYIVKPKVRDWWDIF